MAVPVVIIKSSSNFSALLESADIVYFLSGYAETLNQISPSDPPLGLEVETVIFAARAVVAALAADDALADAASALLADAVALLEALVAYVWALLISAAVGPTINPSAAALITSAVFAVIVVGNVGSKLPV